MSNSFQNIKGIRIKALKNHPDIHCILDQDYTSDSITMYLWKEVNHKQIGTAVRFTNSMMREMGSSFIEMMIEEAARKLLQKEIEMKCDLLDEWNPSSRRISGCLK